MLSSFQIQAPAPSGRRCLNALGEVADHLEQQRAVLVGVVVGGDHFGPVAGRLFVEQVGHFQPERGGDVDDVAAGVAVQQHLAVAVGDGQGRVVVVVGGAGP